MAIALMAAFTGLSVTQGASAMPVGRRKLFVSMSAVALGGGIWSMHFVAMLGMTLAVPFHYNALITLMSALVAILLTGIALLFVHFGTRTPRRITVAGLCVGVGILAMHYLGMSGIREVQPVYSPPGVIIAILAALGLCVASFRISYGGRARRNILLGTGVFGATIFAVHFIAMAGTHFVVTDSIGASGLWLSNEVLAFGVTLTSFLISGAFLLVSVTFGAGINAPKGQKKEDEGQAPIAEAQGPVRLPYEREGQTRFVKASDVACVEAEGRYTFLYHASGRLFCPCSISEMETRLAGTSFVKGHRSYMINTDHVIRFERKKDNGVCFFDGATHLDQAPVSRSYIRVMRAGLGI